MSYDIQAIIEEIAAKVSAVDGVVAYGWDAERIATTPAVLVGLPERVGYRTTYSRRGKKITLTLVVLVGKANARAAHKKLLAFMENSGDRSVFRLVDSEFTDYTTCDEVTVVDAEPDYWINAGVQYLGAEFTLDVIATGA